MHQSIAGLADLYQLNTRLYHTIVGNIAPQELPRRPLNKGTSPHWIIGHLVASRFVAGQLLGLTALPDWAKLFDRGAPDVNPEGYPSLGMLTGAWDDISAKIAVRFTEVTEADLAKAPPFEFEGLEKSARGILGFMHFHESYHLGQLAYIGRLVDGKQLFG